MAALGVQHAMRMSHIVTYGCPALQHFSTLSHKRHDFLGGGGRDIEHKMCASSLSTTFVSSICILRITGRGTTKNVYWTSYKVAHIIVRFKMDFKSSRQIFEKYWNIKFHENTSSGSRVVPCRRTYRHCNARIRFFAILRTRIERKTSCVKFDGADLSDNRNTLTH